MSASEFASLDKRPPFTYLLHKTRFGVKRWYRSRHNGETLYEVRDFVREALEAEEVYGEPRAVALYQGWLLSASAAGTIEDGCSLDARLWAPEMMPRGGIMDILSNASAGARETFAPEAMPGRLILSVAPLRAFTVTTSQASLPILTTTTSNVFLLSKLAKEANTWMGRVAWVWLDLLGLTREGAMVNNTSCPKCGPRGWISWDFWSDPPGRYNTCKNCGTEFSALADSDEGEAPRRFRVTEQVEQARYGLDKEGRKAAITRAAGIVQALEAEERPATPEELVALAAFAPEDAIAPREEWAAEILEIIEEEAPDAQNIIVMDAADVMGVDEKGRAFTALESDELSASVTRALYPGAKVQHGRPEMAPVPEQLADAVVVRATAAGETVRAFGQERVPLSAVKIQRAIRNVKHGGIVVAEIPTALSDNQHSIRFAILSEADFVDALRVPNPDLTWTDVITFRRLKPGERAGPTPWLQTTAVHDSDAEVEVGQVRPTISINSFFVADPDAVGDRESDFHDFLWAAFTKSGPGLLREGNRGLPSRRMRRLQRKARLRSRTL